MILYEKRGDYSQTIRINPFSGNEVKVCDAGKVLYNGKAKHIIDNGNTLSFKDENNKEYKFVKYILYTNA